jgi:hypothetical protein
MKRLIAAIAIALLIGASTFVEFVILDTSSAVADPN